MAQEHKENQLSFIMYNAKDISRFYKIKKTTPPLSLIIFPLISIISIFIIVAGAIYLKELKNLTIKKESSIITHLKKESKHLLLKIDELTKFSNTLQDKLASTDMPEGSRPLNIIKETKGQKILIDKKNITIKDSGDNSEIVPQIKENEITLKFNLVNNSTVSNKQNGFILVTMTDGQSIYFYPKESLLPETFQFAYSRGEYFSFERLRVVEAIFQRPKNFQILTFKILLFSRTGDIIHEQAISYKAIN